MSDPRLQRVGDLLELRRHAEARAVLQPLLAERPDDPGLHGLLAQALLGEGDHAGALAAANRVVALAPDDEWGHRIAAVTLDRMGQHLEATHAAAEAVRRAPLSWQTHKVYAQVAIDARSMGRDARAAAQRAVQLAPTEADAHFVMGLVAHRLSDDQTAVAAYRRALQIDPQHATALHNLTMLESGLRLGRSAQGLGAALRLAPDDELMRGNVDVLAARFVRRLYFAALLAFVVGLAVALAGGPDGGPTLLSVLVAAALVLGGGGYTLALARSIPVGIRRYVSGRLLRDRFLLLNVVLTASMTIAALVCCLVPGGAGWGLLLLQPIGLANVAAFVWAVTRRR
ncbi:tetratricopeptide repeat protein [Nocardioides nanhaiensis]|uniref:Tetratricopeptide repeat protein n=1 Tax=Nocardioides nanhaiensis TaxID=1476871 RepID=A0ABP8WLR9_9ACTN